MTVAAGAAMHPLRALLWPLRITSLMLIAFSAPLIVMATIGGLIGLPGLYMLTSSSCRYADQLLGQALQGDVEPEPLSLEALNPFNIRPLLPIAFIVVVGLLLYFGQGPLSLLLAILLLAVLPVALALAHLEGWSLSVVNPLAWLRFIGAIGPWYLLLLAVGLVGLLIESLASRAGTWLVLQVAWMQYLLFALMALTGAICHRRRFELRYEPMASPERDAARAATERELARAAFIDDFYARIRLGKRGEAQSLLAARLRSVEPQWLDEESAGLLGTAAGWQLPRVLPALGEALLERQLQCGRVHGALETATRLLHLEAGWRPPEGGLRATLVQLAEEAGRKDLSRRLQAPSPSAP
jgi:hypothetical protein